MKETKIKFDFKSQSTDAKFVAKTYIRTEDSSLLFLADISFEPSEANWAKGIRDMASIIYSKNFSSLMKEYNISLKSFEIIIENVSGIAAYYFGCNEIIIKSDESSTNNQ